MSEENGKIKKGSKFISIAEIHLKLAQKQAVVIYRPNTDHRLTAFGDPRDYFISHEREHLLDNLAGAKNFDQNAFLVIKAS